MENRRKLSIDSAYKKSIQKPPIFMGLKRRVIRGKGLKRCGFGKNVKKFIWKNNLFFFFVKKTDVFSLFVQNSFVCFYSYHGKYL